MAQSDDPALQVSPEEYARAVARRDQLPIAPVTGQPAGRFTPDALYPFWQYAGPANFNQGGDPNAFNASQSGRISSVAYDPTHNGTCYAGSPYGGLWKSTDFCNTWTPLSDGWSSMEVQSIAVDPKNGNIIYVGTGDLVQNGPYPQGILKSTDGGATFQPSGLAGQTVNKIVIVPDSSAIIAATSSSLNRSTDGGATWTTIPGSSGIEWTDIAYGPPNFFFPANWFAVGSGMNGTIWHSTDSGATWNAVTSPFSNKFQSRLAVAVSPIHPSSVWVATGRVDQKVYRSNDAGSSWTDVTGNLPVGDLWEYGWYSFGLAVTAVGDTSITGNGSDLVWVLGKWIYQSSSSGNWTGVASGHADQHAIAVDPFDQYALLIGNDGGVYNATYQPELGTTTMFALNKTLNVTQVYRVAGSSSHADFLAAGTQDTGTAIDKGNLQAWVQATGNDGGGTVINPSNDNIQYSTGNFFETDGRNIWHTTDGWATSDDITPSVGTEPAGAGEPLIVDPTNSNRVYLATNWLYRWDESTKKWTNHLGSRQLGGDKINAVAIAPSDGNRIYTASNDGQIWMSTDGGSSFKQINGSLGSFVFTSLSVNPSNENDVLVGVWRNSSRTRLWRCTNPTAANPTWSDVANESDAKNGLPATAVNAIARDPSNPGNVWYVGTDVGVLYTDDAGTHWYNATRPLGLPNVPISDLTINATTGYLTAGTFGRGVWRARIGCQPKTCASTNSNCGTIDDGCGGTRDCGSCAAPATCGGSGTANVCGVCQPLTCGDGLCGTMSDGCGGMIACGGCPVGQMCSNHSCVRKCSSPQQCCIQNDGCSWRNGRCICI